MATEPSRAFSVIMQSEGHGKIMVIPKLVLAPSVHCQIALLKFPRKEPIEGCDSYPFLKIRIDDTGNQSSTIG